MASPEIERYRAAIVESLFADTFLRAWEAVYRPAVERSLGPKVDAHGVLRLGGDLYSVFRSAFQAHGSNDSRGQSGVAEAGSNWERLVAWYLNLGLLGTNSVVVKVRSQVPKKICDALAITIADKSTNSESDLVAVTVGVRDGSLKFPEGALSAARMAACIDDALDKGRTRVGVVQCKTSWADNSQAVMLWNLVYGEAREGRLRGVTSGRNGHRLSDFGGFFYTFVTVPTQRLEVFKPTSLAVLRLRNLSGGKFWAAPTSDSIARNIGEVFRDDATFGPDTPHWDRSLDTFLAHVRRPEFRISALA